MILAFQIASGIACGLVFAIAWRQLALIISLVLIVTTGTLSSTYCFIMAGGELLAVVHDFDSHLWSDILERVGIGISVIFIGSLIVFTTLIAVDHAVPLSKKDLPDVNRQDDGDAGSLARVHYYLAGALGLILLIILGDTDARSVKIDTFEIVTNLASLLLLIIILHACVRVVDRRREADRLSNVDSQKTHGDTADDDLEDGDDIRFNWRIFFLVGFVMLWALGVVAVTAYHGKAKLDAYYDKGQVAIERSLENLDAVLLTPVSYSAVVVIVLYFFIDLLRPQKSPSMDYESEARDAKPIRMEWIHYYFAAAAGYMLIQVLRSVEKNALADGYQHVDSSSLVDFAALFAFFWMIAHACLWVVDWIAQRRGWWPLAVPTPTWRTVLGRLDDCLLLMKNFISYLWRRVIPLSAIVIFVAVSPTVRNWLAETVPGFFHSVFAHGTMTIAVIAALLLIGRVLVVHLAYGAEPAGPRQRSARARSLRRRVHISAFAIFGFTLVAVLEWLSAGMNYGVGLILSASLLFAAGWGAVHIGLCLVDLRMIERRLWRIEKRKEIGAELAGA